MIVYSLGLLGVAVFAVSGALAAGRKGLDWVGVLVLALVTSLGGGTLRDVLLNRPVVFWIEDSSYLFVIVLSSFLTIFLVRFFKPPMNALLYADGLGLALFTIVGAQVAEAAQVSSPIVVLMALLTGAAGGVFRDVLMSELPLLFRATETIYSVTALGGVLAYLSLKGIGVDPAVAAIVGSVTVAILRFSAIIWEIKLPAFHISDD